MKRFEDIIQEKLSNFEYPYQQGAWENYRRRIRMKRIFHWGMASVAFVGVVTTAVILLNNPSKVIIQNTVNKNHIVTVQHNPASSNNSQMAEIKPVENRTHAAKKIEKEESKSVVKQEIAKATTNNTTSSPVKTSENNIPVTVSTGNASFTKSISQGCAPLSVQFNAANVAKGGICIWNFGDGATSNEVNPTHIYQKGGKYKVNLTVKLNEKDNYSTDFQTIQVFNKPKAIIGYTCEDNAVQFESKSKQVVSHKWIIGDTISNSDYWKYEITRSGKYSVKYIVENTDGCSDTAVKEINLQYKMPVQISNIFSPDGDGLNDLFGPQVADYKNFEFTMTIFSKTGKCVYEGKGSPVWWDGTDKETKQPCPADIYIYKIMAVDKQGNKNEYTNKIQLKR